MTVEGSGAKAKINEMATLISPSTEREVSVVITDAGEEPFFRNGGTYELYCRNGKKWFVYSRGSGMFMRLAGESSFLNFLLVVLVFSGAAAAFWFLYIITMMLDGSLRMDDFHMGWTRASAFCLAASFFVIFTSRRSGRREWDTIH